MPIRPELQPLMIIQELDGEIRKIRDELARYPGLRQAAQSELDHMRHQLDEVRIAHVNAQKRLREIERQVAGWRENLGKLSAQQFQVKTQKEYDALTHEMEETRKRISNADEEGLQLLSEEEALAARLDVLEKQLVEKEPETQQEMARLDERETEKRSLLEQLGARRATQASETDPVLLRRYDRLASLFPGSCIAPVQEGNCGGCHMKLIPSRMQELSVGEKISECDSCHRFIYLS